MQAFAQGFSSSGFAFSMTDVGNESQAADKAFKGEFMIDSSSTSKMT